MNNNKRHMQAEAGDLRKASKRSRFTVKTHPIPNIDSIKDLIEMSKTLKFYTGIDTPSLWKIEPHLRELDAMIGMEKLKETVLYQILYYLQNLHTNSAGYLHTVLYSPPGHGKTTVAKILSKLYKDLGILSKDGPFIQANRESFVAGYLGQTFGKTMKVLKSALGGVLFIDEAYSLAPRNSDKDSFSKEAIDAITGFLSEHKDNICCIMAGYRTEMQFLFNQNIGLQRRFQWVHEIDEYSNLQLAQIFMKMVKETIWHTTFDEQCVAKIIEKNRKLFKNGGGSVEEYFAKCRITHAKRVFPLHKQHRFVLTEQDLYDGLEFMKKHGEKTDKEKSPPSGMYL